MRHIKGLKETTRALVHSVDLRGFDSGTSEFSIYAAHSTSSPLAGSLRILSATFPELRCVLLDGHSDLDIGVLASAIAPESPPMLLSIAQCQVQVPKTFFESPFLRNLVYLDVSDMPGSLKGALSTFSLPNLRILKAQGREMDDSTATLLLMEFKKQAWSLDLSRNKVTDRVIFDLLFAFPRGSLRGGHMEVEGELQHLGSQGTRSFGTFLFVKESKWSRTFSHPERYFVDTPEYTFDNPESSQQTSRNNVRLDGRKRAPKDSADAIKSMFSGGPGYLPPSREDIQELDIYQSHYGITHLHLNNNNISSRGLFNMVMRSPGQLQHLECDTMSLFINENARPAWLSSAPASKTVSGILGAAHIFRPVFSSNLQTLRIHHSLVTQLVTLNLPDVSTMSCMWLAETCLLPRAELAYPQAFMPDMNPRIRSLTLTHLPRWSTGPVIDKLIAFLKHAALQEHEIQKSKSRTRRGPTTVEGLRHLKLEFDPDPLEDAAGYSDEEDGDLDPEEMIRLGIKEFSFFEGSWDSFSSENNKKATGLEVRHSAGQPAVASSVSEARQDRQDDESVRLCSNGRNGSAQSSSFPSPLYFSGEWNGNEFKVQVFTGFEDGMAATPAVEEYVRILCKYPELHEDLQVASPCHVAAGVPEGCYIYEAAWRAMLTKDVKIREPSKKELRNGMKDVIEGIKEFRMGTRRDGRLGVHYGGVLEVVRA
ncbi:hypothetical protein QBC43DRAFT_311556 [Cladorrhinum sp. PSN259]|nr:hypothetical protein QBC43DRAFT_311556 [Cladorrhinum sp. PSN259]